MISQWADDWRGWVTEKADGLVLEIGAGDGVNLPYYDEHTRVIATEPDAESLELIMEHDDNVSLAQASAEDLPFPNELFDAIVGTLVFCTIPDAPRALAEARRVLKPGGSLRLVEHVRAQNTLVGAAMHAANPLWHWWTEGCNMDRDTLTAVRRAGFQILRVNKKMAGLLLGIDAVK